MAKTHKDLDYAVDDASGKERIFKTFDEAAGFAVAMALSGKDRVNLDVLIWSKWGAKFYGGDDAFERYKEDPEASVFERFEISVNNVGRVS